MFSPAPASQFPSGNFSRTHLILPGSRQQRLPGRDLCRVLEPEHPGRSQHGGVLTLAPCHAVEPRHPAHGARCRRLQRRRMAGHRVRIQVASEWNRHRRHHHELSVGFLPPVVTPGLAAGVMRAVDVTGDGMDELLIQSSWYGSQSAPPSLSGPGLSLHAITPGATIGPSIQSWPTSSLLAPGGAPPLYGAGGPGSHATSGPVRRRRDRSGVGTRPRLRQRP